MGKVKTYFLSDSTDDFSVVDGALLQDGVQVVGKDEMQEFLDWLAGEVGDADAVEYGSGYDLEAMDFDIYSARSGNVWGALTWRKHQFGFDWWEENVETAEGRTELDKMILEYERIHGEDS